MLIIHILLGIIVILGMITTLVAKNDKLITPVRIGSILQLLSSSTLLFSSSTIRVCASAVMFVAIYLLFELLINKTVISADGSNRLLE